MNRIIILMFFCFSAQKTFSQSYSDAVSFNAGITQDGYGVSIVYNYMINRHDYIFGGVFGSIAKEKYNKDINIPYNDFTINLGYTKNVYFDRLNNFNVNVTGGILFGYEAINNGNKELNNGALILSKPGFIYGGLVGVEGVYNCSEKFSIIINATEFYHANSSLGQLIPYLGLGIRYYTN